jgi:hypothetical protein
MESNNANNPVPLPSLPVEQEQFLRAPFSKKPFFITLAGLFFVLVFIGIYLNIRNNTRSKIDVRKEVAISESVWESLKGSFKDSYLFKSLKQQVVNKKSAVASRSKKTDIESLFTFVNGYVSSPFSTEDKVLGMAAQPISPQKSFLSKIRLIGKIENPENKELEDLELLFSQIGVTNDKNMAISDVIVNGKFGKLALGDRDFDALHISAINIDSSSYLKVSLSDIALVFLSSLLKGPSQNEKGIISVNSEEIYPYLDEYVYINDEISSEIPARLETYLDEYASFSHKAFEETLGRIDSYLEKQLAYEDVLGGKKIVRVETKVDEGMFWQKYSEFLNQVSDFARERKDLYSDYCQTQESVDDCLFSFGYSPETELQPIVIDKIFNIDNLDLLMGVQSQELTGVDLGISVASKILDGIPISSFRAEITYQNLLDQPVYEIAPPANFLSFNNAGSKNLNYLSSKEASSSRVKAEEVLFAKNRELVWEIWDKDLEKLSQNKSTSCQNWAPKFCFEIGGDWVVRNDEFFKSKAAAYDNQYLELVYPSTPITLEGKRIVLELIGGGKNYGALCRYDQEGGYDEYWDVQTEDGATLRISFRDSSNDISSSSLLLDVCYLNTASGYYTSDGPYGKRVQAFASNITKDEAVRKLSDVIKTFKFEKKDSAILEKDYSKAYDQYKTIYLDGAKDDPYACNVRANDNIKKDFGVEALDVVMKQGTKFCLDHKTCLQCKAGKLEFEELLECKGLSCNP